MQNTQHSNKTSLFEELSYKYLPYWPLFVLSAIIFCTCAWAYLRYTTPVYEITATMLIKDEKKGADENQMAETLNFLSAKKIVENELEVIHSATIMNAVVNQMHLYAPVYEEGKVKPAPIYASSPIAIEIADPENLIENAKISFSYNKNNNTVLLNSKAYPLNQFVSTPYGRMKFIINNRFNTLSHRPLYFSLIDPKKATANLLKNLEVAAASRLSSIVKLKLKDELPKRGEDIMNLIMEKYNNAAIEYKNNVAKNTIDFVDERLHNISGDLTNVEKQIQNFRSQKGVVNLSEQGKLYLQNVGENDQKLADINMQLAVLNQVENYVESKNNAAGIVPSTLGVNDPMLSQLLDNLYKSEMEYERLRKTTAVNNPVLLSVTDQIERIRPSILENIRNQRTSLLAGRNNLSNTNKQYNSVLQSIPQKERELVDVSREQSIKNGVYSFLLQKREETALSYASNVADSRIVEAARSSLAPVSPKKPVIYLAAFALAIGFTIILISFKEFFSRKILFRSEIENYTHIPIVAEISKFKTAKGSLFMRKNNVMIEEQFRQLRAAAGLYSNMTRKKKILITSSISGEGKSLICANLAYNLSLSGKKIVLLDMDLRNPQSSKIFKVNRTVGIAEFLEGTLEPYEIIKSTEKKNLYVISAGTTNTNPTELLLNGRINHLLEYLEQSFDYILIDSAPVGPVTDAYILSNYCGLTLYVIRHRYTPKTCIKKLDDNNKIKALKNIAIVFNGIKPRGFIKGDYGFGYGYGHEYGYGYKEKRLKLNETS